MSHSKKVRPRSFEQERDSTIKLRNEKDGIPVDTRRYQCLVGTLIYLSHTSPDIVFAISVIS